jgi:hypothetical protein
MIEVNPIKFVTAKNLGFLAVHSKDVGGLTYVGRWVKTSLLEDIPEGLSMDEVYNLVETSNENTNKAG